MKPSASSISSRSYGTWLRPKLYRQFFNRSLSACLSQAQERIAVKKVFFTVALLLAASAASILPMSFSAPASGSLIQQPVVIDFEDLAPGRLADQYAHLGVTFYGPAVRDYQGLPGFAHSGVKAIEGYYSQENSTDPIEMWFTARQRRVKVWVGLSRPLQTSQTVYLTALGLRDRDVWQATAVLNPSPNPQAIRIPLEVSLPNALIAHVLVNSEAVGLAVDDIEFGVPAPTPTPTPTPTPMPPQNPVVIDFENIATGPVTNQYANLGITFNQPTAINYQSMPGFAHSGVKAIEQCYAHEFCSAPIDMNFTSGQRRVKVWVGYSSPLDTSRTVILRALDAGGAQIGQATTVFNPSASPQAISKPLEVTLPNADIRRAVVSFSPSDSGAYSLAVDDVEFDAAGPPPTCASTQYPTLNLIQPDDNQTVQFNGFMLEAQVNSQDPLATSLTLTVNGPGGATISQQLPLASGKYGPTRVNGLLFPGFNTITVKFQDCRGAVQSGRNITYTPIPNGTSFELLGIEVTQATQGENNTVPLVADKAAVARVFLRIHSPIGQTATINDVYGKLTAQRRDGTGLGDYLPPGELPSLNMITVNTSDDLAARRTSLDGTINFELPPGWLTEGELHLSFRPDIKDSPSSPSNLPCVNCENLIPVNSMPHFVQLRLTRPLNLILAPYIYQPNSNPPFPLTPELLFTPGVALQWTNNVFPLPGNFPSNGSGINLLRILPMWTTTRDLQTDDGKSAFLSDLQNRLAALQSQGGLPGDVRLLGMVPCGCGGQGVVDGQVAFADTWATENGQLPIANYEAYGNTWAHELGHNFGREHAGNWHGEAGGGGFDENFPYYHGGIGLPGLAINTYWWKPDGTPYLIAPSAVNPPGGHAHDFMSYGDLDPLNTGMWVSPYTYTNLFDKFRINTNMTLAQSAKPVEKLVVIGQVGADGSVDLQPFHRVVTGFNSGSGALGEFSLELLDAQGRVLVVHRFDAQAISLDEVGTMGFTVFAPWSASARRIVLKRKETALAERTVSPNAPTVRVLSPNGGESLGTEATILWEGSDPDGDPLTYTVLYNNGVDSTWWPIATGVTTTAIKVDTSLWPGSSRGRVMVRVTDGVNTAEDVTDHAFTVPQKSPLVAIINAEASQERGMEAQGRLMGIAYDPEDGLLPEASLVWTSDRDGLIGKGNRLNLKSLSSGTHTLTLTVTDSQGRKATAQVTNIVRRPASK